MTTFDVLTDDELATVVAGVDVHRGVRETLGMCGCGQSHAIHSTTA